jgi:NADPH2:quinone reductase
MPSIPQTQTALQINRTGGPEVLELNTSAPVPTAGDNQILVKNTHAGVNFIDTVSKTHHIFPPEASNWIWPQYFRSGLYAPSPFPYTLGREGEGTVVSVGSGVTDFQEGDYVGYTGLAAQAEYTVVEPSHAVKVPSGVEPGVTAASLLQGLTALTLIRESHEVKKVS